MGIETAIGLGILGTAGQIAGGVAQSNAAGDIAEAQAAEARAREDRAVRAAAPSAQELTMIERQNEQAERAIARQERLLAEIDPAIMAAGQQALALLEGKEAGALDPIRRQRARQRRELESRLRGQLGSGFETSSAGIEALSRFDEETASALQGAQQQSLGQLLNASAFGVQASGAGFQGVTALGQPLSAVQNIRNRQVQAVLGGPQTERFAGGESVGAMGTAGVLGQAAGSLGGLGGQILGFEMGQQREETRFNRFKDLFKGQGTHSGNSIIQGPFVPEQNAVGIRPG